MYLPIWFVVCALLIAAVSLALDVVQFLRARHHDHLLPSTPRAARG